MSLLCLKLRTYVFLGNLLVIAPGLQQTPTFLGFYIASVGGSLCSQTLRNAFGKCIISQMSIG